MATSDRGDLSAQVSHRAGGGRRRAADLRCLPAGHRARLGDLFSLGLWLAAAVALHDGLIAPITVGTGVALTGVPPRARRYLQGALIVGALITVIAIPLIARQGTQPASKAILLGDYATNLSLLLGMTAAVALVVYALRMLRHHRPAGAHADEEAR